MSADYLLLALRFLRYGLAMLLWGTGLYVTLVAPADVGLRLRARLVMFPRVVAIALTIATALRLPVMTASFGESWADAARPDVLGVTLGTWAGTGWIVDAVLCVALIAGAFTSNWRVTIPIAGLLLVASVVTGHAAIGAGAWSPLHQLIDAAHLLAAGFWLGALAPLALMLGYEGASRSALQTVKRFGVAGQAAVAVVLGTGIANAVLIKGGTPLHWSSTYDVLLSLKVGVVLGMIGLACYNHFGLLPRLAAGSNGAARTMYSSALLEVALGFTAIGLVSVFGTLDAA